MMPKSRLVSSEFVQRVGVVGSRRGRKEDIGYRHQASQGLLACLGLINASTYAEVPNS